MREASTNNTLNDARYPNKLFSEHTYFIIYAVQL